MKSDYVRSQASGWEAHVALALNEVEAKLNYDIVFIAKNLRNPAGDPSCSRLVIREAGYP